MRMLKTLRDNDRYWAERGIFSHHVAVSSEKKPWISIHEEGEGPTREIIINSKNAPMSWSAPLKDWSTSRLSEYLSDSEIKKAKIILDYFRDLYLLRSEYGRGNM